MPTLPGGPEWLVILLIVVLLFGAKKLPELSRSVGQSITSFKKGVAESAEEEADSTASTASAADPESQPADERRDSA